MAEMMGVVAIIVILAAVAFPLIISMQKDLRMRELDDHAQQIYNAVQNRLSAIKASGAAFNEKDPENANTLYGAMTAGGARQQITTMPSDYNNSGERPWDKCELYQLSSDDPDDNAIIREFLFKTEGNQVSSSLLDGSYTIELSPKTGEVYAVYYWELDGGKKDAKAPEGGFAYDSIRGLRDQSDRKPYNLGYYGGGSLGAYYVAPPNTNALKDLQMDLVNKEELYLRLRSADIGLLDGDERLRNSFRVELYVTGESIAWTQSGKKTWTKTYSLSGSKDSVQVGVRPSDTEMDVILDSMRTDLRFSNIVEGILPGSDITVDARVFCDRGQANWNTVPIKSVSQKTNSLYESVSVEDNKQTANVSTVRHLRNLSLGEAREASKSYPGYNPGDAPNKATYNNVSIVANIDFDGSQWADDSVSVLSRNPEGKPYNPLLFFSPISVSEKMTWDSSRAVVNGNNKILRNFVISSGDGGENKGEATGLFGEIAATMQDIRFEDPHVTGANNTGTLAGRKTIGGTVENCHVYSTDSTDPTDPTDKDDVGVTSTGDNVGGLIGNCDCAMEMKNCSVAVNVHGNNYVGGLFGVDHYVQLNNGGNCRVGYEPNDTSKPRLVSISGDGNYVGGIAGQTHAPISDAHVYANISGYSYVGGIAGGADGASTITNCNVGDSDSLLRTVVTGSKKDDASCVGGLVGHTKAGGANDTVFASVSGGSRVGGLAGLFEGNLFENCAVKTRSAATGDQEWVTATGSNVGGFFGEQKGQARGCTSSINVRADGDRVGGFSGMLSGEVSDSSVHGNVLESGFALRPTIHAGGVRAGGFAGETQAAIYGCFASADVSADGECCGGFIGYAGNHNLGDNYFSGFVTGYTFTGGLAGYREGGWWSNNLSSAGVYGSECVGGFVGYDKDPTSLSDCRTLSQVLNREKNDIPDYGGGFAGATAHSTPYPTNRGLYYLWAANYNFDFQELPYRNIWGNYIRERSKPGKWAYEFYIGKSVDDVIDRNLDPQPGITFRFGKKQYDYFPYYPIYHNGVQLPFYGIWPEITNS